MLFQELKNTVSPNIDISHQEFFFFFQTLKLIIDWGFQTFSAVKESAACVCRGYCSCCCGDIRPDRRTKEARARKSSFHASCFHSSALPVQWNSWWSLNEAELADQADGGTGVDGICEAPSPLRRIQVWTADLNEIERKGTVRDEMEKRDEEEEEEDCEGGEQRDKGMKYLLNVIISNHL